MQEAGGFEMDFLPIPSYKYTWTLNDAFYWT